MARRGVRYYDKREGEGESFVGRVAYRRPGFAASLEDFRRACGHLLAGPPRPPTTTTGREPTRKRRA
jgi:hypothetical protein